MSIERLPDGAVLLRHPSKRGLGERLWEALGPEPLPEFERLEQGTLERDATWWNTHSGTQHPAPRKRARKSKPADNNEREFKRVKNLKVKNWVA